VVSRVRHRRFRLLGRCRLCDSLRWTIKLLDRQVGGGSIGGLHHRSLNLLANGRDLERIGLPLLERPQGRVSFLDHAVGQVEADFLYRLHQCFIA